MKILPVLLLVPFLGGCALSAADRAEIINAASSLAKTGADAAVKAGIEKAQKEIVEKLIAVGLSESSAKQVAEIVAGKLGELGATLSGTFETKIKEALNKALPEASDTQKSNLGGVVSSVLMTLLTLASGAAKARTA